jgi:hypothetical protein
MSSKADQTFLEDTVSQRLAEVAVVGSGNGYVRRHMNDPYWTTPLGYKKNGQPFYPMAGADGTDGSNGETGGAGGTGSGGTGTGSEGQGGTGGAGETGGEGAGSKDSTGTTVTKEEYDKVLERMKAADRNQAAALAKLKELEDKDLSEQEKVLKRVPELEASVADLTAENKGLKAKVAFLGLDGFSWHDPDISLGQVDLSEVLKDDGETIDKTKLKKAAEALAKDKPYLSKAVQDDGKGKSGQGAGGNNSGGQGSSGAGVGSGNGGAGSTNALSEEALRKKYPALN